MNPVTAEELHRLYPRADHRYVEALVGGWPEIQRAGINTPLRWCHFLAQCAHETGDLRIVRENTLWSLDRMCELWPSRFKKTDPVFLARYQMAKGDEQALAELAYGGRKDLGNTEEGDGWAFRGGGFQQGTGRAWYREVGRDISVDLEGSPDLIENPRVSLAATLWYWNKHDLNSFADRNYIRAISCQINRGNPFSKYEAIGAKDRCKAFDRAWAMFGQGDLPNPSNDLGVGASGPDVKAVQLQLRELKYAVGNVDGVFGPETRRALAAFKSDWTDNGGDDLEPGTAIGPKTKAALATAEPISRPEREQMTVKDLREAGSTEVAHGQNQQGVGGVLAAIGVASGAVQMGHDEPIKQSLSWVPAYHSFLVPVLEGIRWFVFNALWLVPLIGGIWFYYKGWAIIRARLQAARNGFNLWR